MAQNQGPSIPTQTNSKNLGNVAGVVKGINPPREADGVTEKTYVLWAKRLLTDPVTYELNYYDNAASKWKPLMGIDEESLFILRQQVFGTLNDPQIAAQLGRASLFEHVKTLRNLKIGQTDSETLEDGWASISEDVSWVIAHDEFFKVTAIQDSIISNEEQEVGAKGRLETDGGIRDVRDTGAKVILTFSDEVKRKLSMIGLDEYEEEFTKVRVSLSSRPKPFKQVKDTLGVISDIPKSHFVKHSPRINSLVPKLLINVYGLHFALEKTSFFIRLERYRKSKQGTYSFAEGLTLPEQAGNWVSARMAGYKSHTDRNKLWDFDALSRSSELNAKDVRPYEILIKGSSNYVDIGAEYYFAPYFMHFFNNQRDYAKAFPRKTGQQKFKNLNFGESRGVPYPLSSRMEVQPMAIRLVKKVYEDDAKTRLKQVTISPIMAKFDILGILQVDKSTPTPSYENLIRYRFNK